MTSIPRFVGLPYSPWSLKAKWALDHHGVPYRYVTYLPVFGAPVLRAATGRWRGQLSVPWLLTGEGPIEGSLGIARWADAHGTAKTLFPAGRDETIVRWDERSEAMLSAGRQLVIERMMRSREALGDGVGGPRALRPLLWPLGAFGAWFIRRKYDDVRDLSRCREVLASGLTEVRRTLSGREHLLDAFSYADISMVIATYPVSSPGRPHHRVSKVLQECWTEPELAEEFADVLAWRDGVLQNAQRRSETERRVRV